MREKEKMCLSMPTRGMTVFIPKDIHSEKHHRGYELKPDYKFFPSSHPPPVSHPHHVSTFYGTRIKSFDVLQEKNSDMDKDFNLSKGKMFIDENYIRHKLILSETSPCFYVTAAQVF